MSNNDVITQLFMAWSFGAVKDDPEIASQSFIHQVLTKKMEAFGTGIIVPLPLSLMLELGLEGNPGLSQVVLGEIIRNASIESTPYTLTPEDFVKTFPMLFPNIHDVGFMDEYESKWDAQKNPKRCEEGFRGSDNLVDTPEWWEAIVAQAMRKEVKA